MPKAAARIFLKVKDVKIERLQDITEETAKKEGAGKAYYQEGMETPWHGGQFDNYRDGFHELWNNCYDWPDSWSANPWVWVIEFERCDKSGI